MSSVWDDLPPEPKRDRYGRYLIEGEACTRVTTLIGALDDKQGLINWKAGRALIGAAERPDLFANVRSVAPDDKRTLYKLVEDCAEAGGSMVNANIGTAIHRFIEATNRGWTIDAGEHQQAVNAYQAEMQRLGFTAIPDMVELVVVLDGLKVAGTADLFLNDGVSPYPVVADIKTGSVNPSVAAQLACYSRADRILNTADDTTSPMPAVEQNYGYVIHVARDGSGCDVQRVDLNVGWEAVSIAMNVRQWRKDSRRALTPMAEPPKPAEPSAASDDLTAERIEWIAGRVAALKEHSVDALRMLAERWPPDVPTIKQHRNGIALIPDDQVEAIHQIVTAVEAQVEAPFGDPDPQQISRTDQRYLSAKARYEALHSDHRSAVDDQANQLGLPMFGKAGTMNADDLDQLATIVAAQEQAQNAYKELIDAHIAVLRENGFGVDNPDWQPTAGDEAELADLCDALLAAFIAVEDNELVVPPTSLESLVDKFGGKRALLAAAKSAAEDLGADKPKSTAQIASSPRLVAKLHLMETPSNPTHESEQS